MKKTLPILLTVLLIALCGCGAGDVTDVASGDVSPASDFEYAENETGVTITKYIGERAEIVIPGTIDGKPVTEIGGMAFFENNAITSVKLPGTVSTVGPLAFSRCSYLKTVVLPEGVKCIENSAFAFCIALSEITLPNTLTTLGQDVFNNCTSLKQIRIPSSLTDWGSDAFSVCGLETVELENGLESIGFSAFRDTNIKEVILPESIKEISELAFSNCPQLERITLNEGLISIKDGAFRASGLAEIIIPATVEEITESVFTYCDALMAVKFEGNAPQSYVDPEDPANISYTVYYHEGATGFTSPEWCGHPTALW